MSDEHTEQVSEPRASRNLPVSVSVSVSDGGRDNSHATRDDAAPDEASRSDAKSHEATTERNDNSGSDSARNRERDSPPSEVLMAKIRRQSRLPALDDDAEIGVQKEHIVTRDGKADLLFTGVLLASAAPASAPKGNWQEYRIYQTNGEKHVFSKVTRSLLETEDDTCEADVFDPSPSSVPSQLFRSAREIARQRPMTWMDAAVAFFGYDPLAKVLYRKLSVRFEEQIS